MAMYALVALLVVNPSASALESREAYESAVRQFLEVENAQEPLDALAALSVEDARKLEKKLDDGAMSLRMIRGAILLHTLAGMVAENEGRRDERDWHLERSRRLIDSLKWTPFKGIWLYGISHYYESRLEEGKALSTLTTLSRAFPRDSAVALAIGTLYETMGSVSGDPDLGPLPSPWPVVDVGGPRTLKRIERRAEQQAKLSRAADQFRLALSENPNLLEARVRLGRVSLQLGHRDEAERQWDNVIRADSSSYWRALAFLFRGRLRERDGALAAAIDDYREAARLEPKTQLTRLALSHALFRSGDRHAAAESLAKALASSSSTTDPFHGNRRYFFRIDVFINCVLLLDQKLR